MKNLSLKLILLLLPVLLFSGCGSENKFKAGHIKDDFCGAHINFQYCKCAFHNEYCDAVGMSKKEANKYVNEEYDKWAESELEDFQRRCRAFGKIVKGKACKECPEGEFGQNDKCVPLAEVMADKDENNGDDGEVDESGEEEEDVVCRYDSDCDPICEGSVAWKMGCNPRENSCEKTFDTDCAGEIESFGSLSLPKTCQSGECVRDEVGLEKLKADLAAEQKMWSDTVKEINRSRDGIREAMMEANKNCINGIADMTNVAIMEFSTRIASVLAGGIPDAAAMAASAAEKAAGLMAENIKNLAGAAVDYAGEGLNRLYNYQQGEPANEEEKLKPHEYIKLNCDLYEYFKQVQSESDVDLDIAVGKAKEANEKLQLLP